MVATGISELVMKLVGHSQMALSGMAGLASLQAWLGQELETRGIDAVIYTRYILSILQQDVFIGDDLESTAENHFFPPNKREGLRAKPVRPGRKIDKRRVVDIADCDQQKKSAAVECLLSLSEEECGIESLVDELYLKLKEQQALISTTEGSSGGTSQSDTAGSSDSDSSEPTIDPAQRYYAAFPALSTEALPAVTTAVPIPAEGGIWAAKVTQGLARSDGSAEVGRHTVSPKQVSPLLQGNASEVEQGVEKDTDCQYRPGSEWSCMSCGKAGERGRRQRSPKCIACNNWNSHGGRNKDQALKKQNQLTLQNAAYLSSDREMKTNFSPSGKLPPKNTKAWKDYEYMRPIFIVPKIHSPDSNTSRVRSVRTNQKTESVLDFFFKSREALASPTLDQMCGCGAESIWRCTAGCLNWPEMLGLGADSEDQSWYTEPLDVMVKPSPIPSRRLYNRRTVFSSFSNMAFFENLHAFREAMSDEETIGLDPFGLSSLLNRTLEDSVQDIEDEESDTDSFNTAEESVAEIVVEEVSFTESQDVFADASSTEPTNDQSDSFSDQDEEGSKPASDVESDVAAYPPHIKPHVISLPSDDEETMPQNKSPGPQTPDVGSGWGSPESQYNWPLSEPIAALPMSPSTPKSPTPPTIVVESLWDLHPVLHSGLINPKLDCLRQNSEAIWGCTSLSPHLEKPPGEGLFNVTDNDTTWGFSSSSGSNSHTVSHASSQDNLYDGTGEYGLIDDKCSQSTAPVSGGFGLGSRVWEAASTSPGPIMGHMPTPVSSENEVLDDRPLFYFSLGDDDYEDNKEVGPDSPLPIPPLEFNFSDSDDDEEATSSPTSASHPASHHPSPTQTHSHTSSPHAQHSFHPHSCSTSRHHVNIWDGQLGADGGNPTQSQSQEVCEGSDRGIMASLTCDTLESNSPMSPRGTLSHDVLLTTMFPDKSSIWSYCMGNFLSPNPGSDQSLFVSPYAEEWPTGELLGMWPLSPKYQGSDLSHLWDVNAVQRSNFCELGSEELAVGGETQNIRRYLMNLRFEVPGQECALINNGLCGSLLTSEGAKSPLTPIWSHNPSPQEDGPHTPTVYDYTPAAPIEEHHNSERVQLWENFKLKPQIFRQRSTSADHTDNEDVMLSPSRSTGLLPSENSAFCDQIPRRVIHLPHVQSEPALDRQHTTHGRVYNHGRLVQVRSLYKSDLSILHQLGLTCGREEDPQEVEVLPHTHFQPIKNDVIAGVGPKTKADADIIERVPTPTGPVPEICPVLGRQSTYQLYHHPDDDEEIANFIPRFQVQKSTEKCCQTGEKIPLSTPEVDASASRSSTPTSTLTSTPTSTPSSEHSAETELDGADLCHGETQQRQEDLPEVQDPVVAETSKAPVSESGDAQQEALGMFLYDMQDVLELSVEDAERFMSSADTPPIPPMEDKDEVDYSSDYESMGEQASIEELGRAAIAELWEGGLGGDAARPSCDTPVLGAEGQAAGGGVTGAMHGSAGTNIGSHSYRSIWSWGDDGDLPSLPNSFSSSVHEAGDSFHHPVQWSQGDLDVSFTDAGLADVSVGSIGEEKADAGRTSTQFTLDPRWADDGDDVFIDDPDVQMQLAGVDPNPEPDQVIFSSDLEQHWLNTRSSFTVQVPNPGQLRHSGQRKPCSFFMEGNCRRTDCKFAHDISNITCRFWEESNCFKGLTCPFLHGYPRAESSGSKRSSSERDFSLEREEFPELHSHQGDDQTAARETNPISRRRNGTKKLDDRVRVTASGDTERIRRRYKVSSSALSHSVKHSISKSILKDGQDKKEESMLSTDV